MKGWTKKLRNYVKQGKGFYVSYLAKTDPAWDMLSGALGRSIDRGDGQETALVKDGYFLILKGDHRASYDALVEQGYDACLGYYNKNKHQRSNWSNDDFEDWKKNEVDC